MTQRARTPMDDDLFDAPSKEGETVQQRLIREEEAERDLLYAPTMSNEEIEAFIVQLHENRDERIQEQREATDSVRLLRENREMRVVIDTSVALKR